MSNQKKTCKIPNLFRSNQSEKTSQDHSDTHMDKELSAEKTDDSLSAPPDNGAQGISYEGATGTLQGRDVKDGSCLDFERICELIPCRPEFRELL